MRKKAKAKAKGKATTRRKRTRDLGAKKAVTVKGGIAWGGPTLTAAKVDYKLIDAIKAPAYKSV